MMMNEEIKNIEPQTARPKFLSVLCILTFIFTGLGCLSSLITPLFAPLFREFIENAPNYDEAAMAESMRAVEAGWGYYLLTLLINLGSLTGAILMWKLNKNGFHFYALSNSAMLFLPTLFLGISISWFAIFFTASFIGMYAVHLKVMK